MPKTAKLILVTIIATLIGAAMAWAGSDGSVMHGTWAVFAICAAWAFLLNWLVFIPSAIFKTEHYFDLTGALTYITTIALALYLSPEGDMRVMIAAAFVFIWAARLGFFLFMRIKKDGKDSRFDERKNDPLRFLITWTVQALWVVLTAAAALAIITSTEREPLGWAAYIGIAVWIIGFAIEAIADAQKSAFKKNPANKGKFIDVGLWKWSRHPNYFGEITLWTGMAILALPILSGWQWAVLISPVFVFLLLTKVSGINLQDKQALKRWGDDTDYQRYRKNTPALFPRPPKS